MGIEPEASSVDVTRAYRKRAMETHPDRNPDNPNATAEFVAVGRAYDILKDPRTRTLYNQQLKLRSRTSVPNNGSLRSNFFASDLYKDFRYTDVDVQRYKEAEERLHAGQYRSEDLSTAFNFRARGPRNEQDLLPEQKRRLLLGD